MANGADRIFRLMKKSGENTISSAVFLTISSISPLTFKLDDRLSITSEFYILSDDIIISRLQVGQKVMALTFNDGQCYFIEQAVTPNSTTIKSLIINNLTSTSIIDSLSANQGKVLKDLIDALTTRMTNVENRTTVLETRADGFDDDIESLDSRVTALEQRI